MKRCMSDQVLKDAVPVDLYAEIAARVFRVRVDDVTPDQKRKVRVAAFGALYGMKTENIRKLFDV